MIYSAFLMFFTKCKRIVAPMFLVVPVIASGQFSISSYTIDGGGGSSSGGAYSLNGTIGQPDASASSSETYSLNGGFWSGAFVYLLEGFPLWANSNVPMGQDRTFGGDWDSDGVTNGFSYIFGPSGIQLLGAGRLTAPPVPPPSDVSVVLQTNTDLSSKTWVILLDYQLGVLAFQDPSVNIINGVMIHNFGSDPRRFYRYVIRYTP